MSNICQISLYLTEIIWWRHDPLLDYFLHCEDQLNEDQNRNNSGKMYNVLKVFSKSNDEKCERVQIVPLLFGESWAEVLTYLRTQKLFGNDRILSIDILYLWLTALQMAPWLTHLIFWSGWAIHHCFLVSKQLVCIQCHLPIISRNNNHRAAGCRPAPAAAFLEIHSGFL